MMMIAIIIMIMIPIMIIIVITMINLHIPRVPFWDPNVGFPVIQYFAKALQHIRGLCTVLDLAYLLDYWTPTRTLLDNN